MCDVETVFENEWKTALLLSFRDKPRTFTCFSNYGMNITVSLSYNDVDFTTILFKWDANVDFNNCIVTNFTSILHNKTYFDDTHCPPQQITPIIAICIQDIYETWDFYNENAVFNSSAIQVIHATTKHYFFTLRQQHIERNVSKLHIATICDWYATKTGEEFAKITNYLPAEMVLWNSYLVENIAKFF